MMVIEKNINIGNELGCQCDYHFLKCIDILKEYEGSKIIQDRILSLLDRGNAMALSLQKWQNFGIWIMTRVDEEYPIALKRKLGQKSPPILYGAGDKKILNTKGITIVGSRDASMDDLEFAFQLGKKLLCADIV